MEKMVVNIYKIKYQRVNDKKIFINSNVYNDMIQYILKDCKNKEYEILSNNIKLNSIYSKTKKYNFT